MAYDTIFGTLLLKFYIAVKFLPLLVKVVFLLYLYFFKKLFSLKFSSEEKKNLFRRES